MGWLKSILSSDKDSLSSKRLMGILVILAVIGVYIYCAIAGKEMSDVTYGMLTAGVTLLGVESVCNIFKKE